ncbi:hypothetical protein [Lentilactobacillus buchneri]|uniref:Uncharacterized protein n=1 Tax=Lentilactobacillus buchneri subsp. silagei CD034 TaxID=1071400 RepID=J9VYU7_LENBU|nr:MULTISPECIES: hypothetical protein [Lentilactobacillus]MCC6100894.1 hypothetical protein [Lactobacillus sp.]AFR99408.1 hypothetical protein LBUCD034_0303 [Lentilactobacillus buchneri subsp. silagei CD034]MCT2900837.1 hypothetical protein [Lentilactobacillus buchneri]MCT3542274.1 hypothetical protein [Lentilactobacillus buchneri]MCT3546103.1 hypothetical protein [Lentilactobacillus buchneri]
MLLKRWIRFVYVTVAVMGFVFVAGTICVNASDNVNQGTNDEQVGAVATKVGNTQKVGITSGTTSDNSVDENRQNSALAQRPKATASNPSNKKIVTNRLQMTKPKKAKLQKNKASKKSVTVTTAIPWSKAKKLDKAEARREAKVAEIDKLKAELNKLKKEQAANNKVPATNQTTGQETNGNVTSNNSSNSTSTQSTQDTSGSGQSAATSQQTDQLTPSQQADQDAQDANTQLQPSLTRAQITYYQTASVSNVVGQGVSIVNAIAEVISALRSLI